MLHVDNVSKSFEDRSVLNNLNLDVEQGTIFALVGVNGAGKTTLLRTVAGIYKPDSGLVTFDDMNVYYDEMARRDIFLVSDDPYYPFAENMNSLKHFYKAFYNFDESLYNEYLVTFGLNEKQPISSFSKGMKRQAMLVFALAIKPKLLLLDEAFDGLDPIVRYELKKVLSDFILDNNSTIIISSHNLKELEDICDEYGILSGGKITTYGDLIEKKSSINKYQVGFKQEVDHSVFDRFNVLHMNKEGSVYTLVIKGERDEIESELNKLNPVIMDVLNVNFEELFIYEHEEENNDF